MDCAKAMKILIIRVSIAKVYSLVSIFLMFLDINYIPRADVHAGYVIMSMRLEVTHEG